MSHHFDTRLAKEDPSLNLCDFYLFGSSAETVGASGVYRGLVLSLSRPGWWICGQRKRVAHNPTAATSAEAEISSATTAGIFTPHRG